MKKQTLVAWIVRWSERPGMYLAGPSDKGEPDISNLWLLMHGYLLGAGHLEGPPLTARQKDAADEMRKFESWVAQKRPDYFRETWFGNSVLEEAGGNHWKAADWLETATSHGFLSSQMDKFDTRAPTLELYGSTLAMDKLHELLAGRGTLEFKELPEDQLPRRPKLPPRFLRKPYVPRRKR